MPGSRTEVPPTNRFPREGVFNMTTVTAGPATGSTVALPAARGRSGFAGAVRSELTKIRSTRSTYWTLLALVIVTVGLGALVSFGAAQHPGEAGPGFDATQRSLGGLYLSQLIIVVLGALTITSEYSTGMIRTSLTAQPRRGTLFAAKATVFAAVSLVTGLVVSFLSFFTGQAIMSGHTVGGVPLSVSLGDPNVLRAVIGGGLFLAACGMLAFGLGVMLRHTAGAITASIGLLFVLSIVVNFLPQSWQDHVDKWMPAIAGTQIWATRPDPSVLAPWTGFAVLCGYAAAAMIGGWILFKRRDA
jgi:ABC-2 type transport system permease protein